MQFILVANFKSNKTGEEVLAWVNEVGPQVAAAQQAIQIVLCPQFPALTEAAALIKSSGFASNLLLGSQNVSAYGEGAFTGEVAANSLQGICQYVIIGHSERRKLLVETAKDVQAKAEQAIGAGLKPIICISQETLEEAKEYKNTDVIFAFEPPAAIGRGEPEDIGVITQTIKSIHDMVGDNIPVLYGGSVAAPFVKPLQAIDGMGGFLVGSASLDPKSFLEIYHAIR